MLFLFFFFNDTATTEIYTLSLHDALPICRHEAGFRLVFEAAAVKNAGTLDLAVPAALVPHLRRHLEVHRPVLLDRKSTRLNSSHANISYAVFCLKKKKNTKSTQL